MDQSSSGCWDEMAFLPQISDTLFHFHFALFTFTFAPKLSFSNFVLHNFISPRLQPSFHSRQTQIFALCTNHFIVVSGCIIRPVLFMCFSLFGRSIRKKFNRAKIGWMTINVSGGAIDPTNIIHHSTIKTCWWVWVMSWWGQKKGEVMRNEDEDEMHRNVVASHFGLSSLLLQLKSLFWFWKFFRCCTI